jgi:hypothetical protein
MRSIKVLLFTAIFTFFGAFSIHAQIWTVSNDAVGVTYEWAAITVNGYHTLLDLYESSRESCLIYYTSVLEADEMFHAVAERYANRSGYYFLSVIIDPQLDRISQKDLDAFRLAGMSRGLVYGHEDTGYLILLFGSKYILGAPNIFSVGSNEYTRIYEQIVGLVNGE